MPACNNTSAVTRLLSTSVSVVRVQYDSVRRLWLKLKLAQLDAHPFPQFRIEIAQRLV